MTDENAQPAAICLLRQSTVPDPYEEALRAAGYAAYSVPVLRFAFVNQDRLRTRLNDPESYAGLIVTSPRAVQALRADRTVPGFAAWLGKPAFAVGPRTAGELAHLGFRPVGDDTGTAEALATRIATGAYKQPLLFLAGDRRRDVLPRYLSENGVPFEELCVYETHVRDDLTRSEIGSPTWVVFFSPSGVTAALHAEEVVWERFRKAAIGPTTAAALKEQGWIPEAVASEPTPEALRDAILTYDTHCGDRS